MSVLLAVASSSACAQETMLRGRPQESFDKDKAAVGIVKALYNEAQYSYYCDCLGAASCVCESDASNDFPITGDSTVFLLDQNMPAYVTMNCMNGGRNNETLYMIENESWLFDSNQEVYPYLSEYGWYGNSTTTAVFGEVYTGMRGAENAIVGPKQKVKLVQYTCRKRTSKDEPSKKSKAKSAVTSVVAPHKQSHGQYSYDCDCRGAPECTCTVDSSRSTDSPITGDRTTFLLGQAMPAYATLNCQSSGDEYKDRYMVERDSWVFDSDQPVYPYWNSNGWYGNSTLVTVFGDVYTGTSDGVKSAAAGPKQRVELVQYKCQQMNTQQ